MNQKTILGLAAIIALTIISVAGFYFFSPKQTSKGLDQVNANLADTTQTSASTPATATLAVSEPIAADEVDGIDVQELTQAGKKSPTVHQPEMLSFEFDQQLNSADTLEYLMAYDELPEFEQKNIRQYQQYIVDKIAKDTGKSTQQIRVATRGALESEQLGNRYYVYKLNVGTDCEIYRVSTDINQGDYKVSYNKCSG